MKDQAIKVVNKVAELVSENPEVPAGAAIGAAYGVSVGVSMATISVLQIATYPLYMASCAAGPFVRLAAPIYVPPITASLGMLVGIGYKMLKKLV